MRTGKFALLLALAVVTGPAMAEEDVGIGPWQLGMSKEQVLAFAEQGPYKDAAAGAVETDGARFSGHKADAMFSFAGTGLGSIRVTVYDGTDWSRAVSGVLEVFDYFKSGYGGANLKDILDNPDRDALQKILQQLIGTAEPLNKDRLRSGNYMIVTYDLMPLKQPAASRLHCQAIYNGKTNSYAVYLYQDLPKAPKREVEDNVEIKKL